MSLYLLFPTFLIINFSIFCILYICMHEPEMIRQIFFRFLISDKSSAVLFNSLLIPGIKRNN